MSMLRPIAPRPPAAISRSIPAPVGGWNTRDALAAMKEIYAPVLDNFFPDQSGCNLRRGTEVHASGMTGAVESLLVYNSPTTSKMFAANGTAVYDVSSDGAVGAAVLTAQTNARWQHTCFGTGGTTYLFMCNGADTPQKYNGSAFAATGFSGSGLTMTTLIHVNVFKQRLFFVEKDSLRCWYGDVSAVSGTLLKLDFADQAKLGGYLTAMVTWTIDGGSGSDDYAVFLTSNGEAIVYAGTDPAVADSWALKGVYKIAPPLSRRCFVNYGGDVALMVRDGLIPLSLALTEEQKGDRRIALSDIIAPTWSETVRSYGSNYGFEVCLHPTSQMMICNMPLTTGSRADQYVMNTTTRAWCRFRNLPANCFAIFNNELYFGDASGRVQKADTGMGDLSNTVDIVGEGVTAFNYFGSVTRKKQVTMVRPTIKSDAPLTSLALGVDTDFNIRIPATIPSTLTDTFSTWDVAEWDVAEWAGYLRPQVGWQSVATTPAYSAAVHVKTSTKIQAVNWVSNDLLLIPGSQGP